jgi:uncharacterized protein
MIWLLFFLTITAHATDVTFEKTEIKIDNVKAHVQIADTEESREHGLMYVEKLPINDGMLFVFEDERPLSFWMKNTKIPLNIGFFDSQCVLIDVQEMTPASPMELHPKVYPSAAPATFALEMNPNWFNKNHLHTNKSKIALAGIVKSALLKQKMSSCARQTSSRKSDQSRQTGD